MTNNNTIEELCKDMTKVTNGLYAIFSGSSKLQRTGISFFETDEVIPHLHTECYKHQRLET